DGAPYDREECPIYAAFKDGLVHTVNDELFWRKDGTSLPVEYTSTPIRDKNDHLVGAVVTFRDITQRKQAERALRDALGEVEELKDQLQAENVYLQEEIKLEHNFDNIISTSESFKRVLRNVEQVASTDATVLVLGETGTGKELIARALHTLSPRKGRPLVKVNCATLPANLIESELFGHEKGAFTGAVSRKQGRFELADHGTIFLDEIGDLPLDLQAKLLRVLQEGEFERLGGTLVFRTLFAADSAVKKAIVAISREEKPHKSQTLGRLAGPMKSIGYIEETLRRAGLQAYRDVIKAVPPMAVMAALARAFPFLPRASRGWAAVGTLIVGAAVAMVGIARLFS
ncbi:MAG: sigma 54-interacting transcriptional regulator, partial [bacterium]|nr:sigma 54-interacting transcriptional regulator [bacterium]